MNKSKLYFYNHKNNLVFTEKTEHYKEMSKSEFFMLLKVNGILKIIKETKDLHLLKEEIYNKRRDINNIVDYIEFQNHI